MLEKRLDMKRIVKRQDNGSSQQEPGQTEAGTTTTTTTTPAAQSPTSTTPAAPTSSAQQSTPSPTSTPAQQPTSSTNAQASSSQSQQQPNNQSPQSNSQSAQTGTPSNGGGQQATSSQGHAQATGNGQQPGQSTGVSASNGAPLPSDSAAAAAASGATAVGDRTITVPFTTLITNADGSTSTSTGVRPQVTNLSGANQGGSSSNTGRTWGIVGGVLGGIVLVVAIVFIVWKMMQRRFSELDDEGLEQIKWPELKPDANEGPGTLNPFSTHRTGRAGIEMGGDDEKSEYGGGASTDYTRVAVSEAPRNPTIYESPRSGFSSSQSSLHRPSLSTTSDPFAPLIDQQDARMNGSTAFSASDQEILGAAEGRRASQGWGSTPPRLSLSLS